MAGHNNFFVVHLALSFPLGSEELEPSFYSNVYDSYPGPVIAWRQFGERSAATSTLLPLELSKLAQVVQAATKRSTVHGLTAGRWEDLN